VVQSEFEMTQNNQNPFKIQMTEENDNDAQNFDGNTLNMDQNIAQLTQTKTDNPNRVYNTNTNTSQGMTRNYLHTK
jgi:hypothetical protein